MSQQQVRSPHHRTSLLPHFQALPGAQELSRQRIVVEIVDVGSSEFHKVQQVRFSKLLNLKMRKRGGPLSPRRLLRVRENPLFSAHFVSERCGELVEKLLSFVELLAFRIFNIIYSVE